MARAKKASGIRQSGHIFVWDYPEGDKKSYGGWHLTADDAGLAALFGGVDQLAASTKVAEVAFPATAPPASMLRHVHRKRHSGTPPAGYRVPREVVLRAASGGKPWRIREADDRVEFTFDRLLIPMLRRQLERLAEGSDDLGFGGSQGFEGWRQRLSLWRKPG
jgi:hypothetical protein